LPEQTQSVAAILEGRLANAANSSDDARIRAIFESARSLPQVNQATLLHGDYWPGNLLWKDDHLVAVIDWEDAHVGDPLADFAISRLDTLLIFGIAAMQDFTQQYQSMTAIDFTHLPYWDLCAALRAAPHLAEWAVGYPLVGRPDITENILRKGYELFINQAFEKIGAYT
jgi:aminoglycoside phosphotransferase (APT) family kinase protein